MRSVCKPLSVPSGFNSYPEWRYPPTPSQPAAAHTQSLPALTWLTAHIAGFFRFTQPTSIPSFLPTLRLFFGCLPAAYRSFTSVCRLLS